MAEQEYTLLGESRISYKGSVFLTKNLHSGIPGALDYLDSLKSFHIRDDDVFIVTFPKSGTTWMQYIIYILFEDSHPELASSPTYRLVPFLEYCKPGFQHDRGENSRLYCTHLQEHMAPQGLKNKKGKVIYVMRNPKDVLVSYFHFSKILKTLDTSSNLDQILEDFLSGKVYGGSWFDHVKGWFEKKDKYNILFVSYEEMKMDLRSVVRKVSEFVGKSLSDEDMDKVVDRVTFENMKNDPKANYDIDTVFDKSKGNFMRKGTIGDWKNSLTVAQSEHFDQVYQERMKDLPLQFIWDIKELHG